jgi:hypothetical protein
VNIYCEAGLSGGYVDRNCEVNAKEFAISLNTECESLSSTLRILSVNENQLVEDLFTQTLEERRLKRIWPETLLD